MNDEGATPQAVHAVDLAKSFDRGIIHALNGVSLTILQSEFVAITGPSGCGKSTLLHLIAGLDSPTSGSVFVNGQDVSTLRDANEFRRRQVGLIFQLHNLLPHLTALQNVEIAMFSNGKTHREQREKARRLLADVGLAGKEKFEPTRLSGGERQRVAIARALANEPSLLLADEPTGSLDSEALRSFLNLLNRIRNERTLTIVLVTHDERVAASAERTVQMRDGQIVAQES